MPLSYGMYYDLLGGNLPVCFIQLRILLEGLTKSYYADSKYPPHLFFEQKLEMLEEESKQIAQIMKEVERNLLLLKSGKVYNLWKYLSKEWVHEKGIIKRIVDRIVQGKGIPSYGLVLPMSYQEEDMTEIEELGSKVSEFRKILREITRSWKYYLR